MLLMAKKGYKFRWTRETQEAFEKLTKVLISLPVLPYLDPSEPFALDCDARGGGLGGLSGLPSPKCADAMRLVAYCSKKLTPVDKSYYVHSERTVCS